MRVVSLNLNGIRSASKKGVFSWVEAHAPDIVCLQETRIQDHQITEEMRSPGGLYAHYIHAEKPGYSGVGIWSRKQPDAIHEGLGIADFDTEARVLAADFKTLRVISLYLPSGSSNEERQSFKYRFMENLLPWMDAQRQAAEHVLVCGDWNIAHRKIDLKNWRVNLKNSGFLPEERAWMDGVFDREGWSDVYGNLYPEHEGEAYTWWSNRGKAWANNTGWRIDYHVATPELAQMAQKAAVYREERFSDHAPLTLDYAFPSGR